MKTGLQNKQTNLFKKAGEKLYKKWVLSETTTNLLKPIFYILAAREVFSKEAVTDGFKKAVPLFSLFQLRLFIYPTVLREPLSGYARYFIDLL